MLFCLFDIDGTLLSSGGAGKAAMEAALQSAFGAPDDSSEVPYSGRTDRAIARDLFRMHDIPHNEANWQRFVGEYLRHLPAFMGRHQGRILPGIADLLMLLAKHNDVCVGLLTGNVRDGARIKLTHFDIFHHFHLGGFGDLHFERDHVAHEALAAVHAHARERERAPREIWVIGDTPLDIQCARAIGARVAAVATGWHPPEELHAARPDLLCRDLSDYDPLLDRMGLK